VTDTQCEDDFARLDLTLEDLPVIDGEDPQSTFAGQSEIAALVQENHLEDTDVSAPTLEIVSPDPTSSSEDVYMHGIMALGRGDWVGAAESLRRALELDPRGTGYHTCKCLCRLAYAEHRLGNLDAAIERYEASLKIEPNQIQAGLGLAIACVAAGHPDRAISALQIVRVQAPDLVPVSVMLAGLCTRSERSEDAERCYREALRVDPSHEVALINLGALLAQQKRYEEACEVLTEACDHETPSWRARFNLGLVLGRLHRWDDAIELMLRLCEDEPSQTRGIILAARLMRCAEQQFRAIEFLSSAGHLGDCHAAGQELIGLIHFDLDNCDQAMAFWEEALALNPEMGRVHVHMARLHLKNSDYERAEASIERALDRDDRRPENWLIRGQVDLGLDRPEAAVTAITRSIQLDGRSSEAHYWLGRAHLETGSVLGAWKQVEWLEKQESTLAPRLKRRIK